MSRTSYATTLLVIAIAIAAASSFRAQTPKEAKQVSKETLNEQARKNKGTFLWRYVPQRMTVYRSLDDLARDSDIVIVGRTIGHRSRLRADGKFITKDFSVRVQEVLKGEVANGSLIEISLPGGAYKFPDGTVAFVMLSRYKQAEDLRTYVFFLKKKGSLYKGHPPVSETQAVFDLTGGKVQPADLVDSDPIVSRYRDMNAGKFLAELHKATPRKKPAGN